MRRLAPLVLLACLSVLAGTALAVDKGQFGHVPPDIRAWFKSVMSPNGIPCCDISDGHRTKYQMREGHYWVPVEEEWTEVPPHTVVRNAGNPIGEAVVWYYRRDGAVVIRCFVPASEV